MECKDLLSQGMWCEGLGTPVMSASEIMAVLRSFGMGKFAGAVMWVIHEVFGGVNENEKCPQENTDGHGSPQVVVKGECEFTRIICKLSINSSAHQAKASNRELKEIGPQADGDEWSEISRNGQKWNRNKRVMPWMICEPNEVEGRILLAEIMQGGNFGQYDTRDAALKKGGMMKHGLWKLKRVMRLVSSYPEEALWEPVFRV